MNPGRRLKRYLLTGFLIFAPMSITAFLLFQFVRILDGFLGPLAYTVLGHRVPGIGLILAMAFMLLLGFVGSNLTGKHLLEWVEGTLLHIPVFSWLYGTIKQLTEVFSPDGKLKFKSVVLIEFPRLGVYSVGFVTNMIRYSQPNEPEKLLYCVYIPTNHVHVGDIVLVPEERVLRTTLTLQEGIQCFLSAGATIPSVVVSGE